MLRTLARRRAQKPRNGPNLPRSQTDFRLPLHTLKVGLEGALWTFTLTTQLPFTASAPPFWTIKNIIFLPANFLC